MSGVLITEIYNEIIKHYRDLDFQKLIEEALKSGSVSTINGEKLHFRYSVSDALFDQDKAYRQKDTQTDCENDLEKIRRYLTDYFKYLMQNVLCLDMKLFRSGNTYSVNEKDAPIIKEILLRACSHHEKDLIIGKWLSGKIRERSYDEIVLLNNRLVEVINDLPHDTCDPDTAERWKEALRLALRTDLARAMDEMEFSLWSLFTQAIPFQVENTALPAEDVKDVSLSDVYQRMEGYLGDCGRKLQEKVLNVLYYYFDSLDYERLRSVDTFPPVELMQLKNVCLLLAKSDLKAYMDDMIAGYEKNDRTEENNLTEDESDMIHLFPNPDKIEEYMIYFRAIEKAYQAKQEERKGKDRDYHNHRNRKSKKGGADTK